MKVKKKFMITMASLISVLALSVIAIVAIFAAMNNSVQSGLTIRYNAVDVSATVKANYIVGSTRIPMVTESGEDEIVFRPTSETNASFNPPVSDDIELSTSNDFVVFEYIFTNDSNSIDVAVDLDATAFSVTNMDISYAYSYERIRNIATMPTTNSFEPMMILGLAKENGFYETLYVYVKIKVSNLANDAFFEGNMDFSLTKATPVKLEFENITGATNAVLLQPRLIPANVAIDSLPVPTFTDGKIYTWYNEPSLETMVSYSFIASDDLTVYAGVQPYDVTVSEDGAVTTIENLSEDPIYLSTGTNTTFTFGASVYSNDGAYILVEEGQSVSVSSKAGAINVNYASPVSSSNIVKNIYIDKPADLETKKFYAAYGEYPQTYVGNALNEELKSAILTPTGKSYATDIDGTETTLVEYSYNGKKYAKVNNSQIRDSEIFSTGETVVYQCFFYVEPIVAKAYAKNTDGSYTMMTLSVLGSRAFNIWGEEEENGEYDNSWQNSDLRGYLNNEFLNESGLSDIAIEQSITNTDHFGTSPVSGNTNDKIWLASVEEILNWSGSGYGLDTLINDDIFRDENDDIRKIKPTDMAIATYTFFNLDYNGSCYYLRSVGNNGVGVCVILSDGCVAGGDGYELTHYGFCPVFAVNV